MKRIILLLLVFSQMDSFAQLPCSKPIYRQFDFWIGEWEAFGPKGNKAGDSRISLLLDSCTILEEWISSTVQRGLRYSGKSYNMYNAAEKQWQQYWIDNTGSITHFSSGRFENNVMILQTANTRINDTVSQLQRVSFYHLGKDKIRQHGEISTDAGKSWSTNYDLEYRRKVQTPAAIADSLLRNMEALYNNGKFLSIADHYAENGKVTGKKLLVSGRKALMEYWKSFESLAGTWALSVESAERQHDMIWVKGQSVITDKNKQSHKVDFTLVLIKEKESWKIFQDSYW